MADGKRVAQDSPGPGPAFSFTARFGDDADVPFADVTGLTTGHPIVEQRHGNGPVFTPIKMPGGARLGVVALHTGLIARDSTFWAWLSDFKRNAIARRTVVIKLLDATGTVVMAWTLHDAWPAKVTNPNFHSDGDKVAVELVEIAFDKLDATNA